MSETPEAYVYVLTDEAREQAAAATDLLPCPFCGSTDVTYDAGAMECGFCSARGPTATHGHIAETSWNTRARE
jgi:hypothetical protein